jgi:hypothetical protein
MENKMINKQNIEKALGYEINDFDFSPIFIEDKIIGLSVRVVPKRKIEFIDLNFKVLPTGINFEDDEELGKKS